MGIVGTRYFGNDHRLVPSEELGYSVTLESLANELMLNGYCKEKANDMVNRLEQSIDDYLLCLNASRNKLIKELLYSILLDCIKFERPLSNSEKEDRRYFFAKIKAGKAFFELPYIRTSQKGKDAKSRTELINTLMYLRGDGELGNQKVMSAKDALMWSAKWLFLIGTKIGQKNKPGQNSIERKVHAELRDFSGEKFLSKAIGIYETIKRTYQNYREHKF